MDRRKFFKGIAAVLTVATVGKYVGAQSVKEQVAPVSIYPYPPDYPGSSLGAAGITKTASAYPPLLEDKKDKLARYAKYRSNQPDVMVKFYHKGREYVYTSHMEEAAETFKIYLEKAILSKGHGAF